MSAPSVDLGGRPYIEVEIDNLLDTLASIEELGELYPGEETKLRRKLAELEKLHGPR